MTIPPRHEAILPIHVMLRGPIHLQVESPEQMRKCIVQLRIRHIDTDTASASPRERDHLRFELPCVISKPSLRSEHERILEYISIKFVYVVGEGDSRGGWNVLAIESCSFCWR